MSNTMNATATDAIETLRRRLFEPVDIAALVYFRLAFGGIMLVEVYRYFTHGWIGRYWIEPTFHFSYYGFDWVHPWPGVGMVVHWVALGIVIFGLTIGLCYRLCAILFFFGFTYTFLLDQARYLNHFYFVCLLGFILMFLPAHRAFSLDAKMRPSLRADTVPAWTLWLLRAQVGIVYFYGGIAKINSDWLHGSPLWMWLDDSSDLFLIGPYFSEMWVVYLFAWGGMLFDLLIVPGLLWRKTRWLAFFAAIVFNFMNHHLFQIGIFPWVMLAGSVLFFDPDWPRRIFNRWPHGDPVPATSSRPKWVMAGLGVYLLVQTLAPLRHWLYPGVTSWTEEGHLFSWQMKLRDKSAEAEFFATDPATGKISKVDLAEYLDDRQISKMSTRPDMILQMAHHLAEVYRERGMARVEIRADVSASLNGRKHQRLIDPNVDLAAQPQTLRAASWILPLTEPLPPMADRPEGG